MCWVGSPTTVGCSPSDSPNTERMKEKEVGEEEEEEEEEVLVVAQIKNTNK
jgi:hypothetical protein